MYKTTMIGHMCTECVRTYVARGFVFLLHVLCQFGGKSVKKSLTGREKTGWSPHNSGRDYVGALGISYSGSATLNRISERISAWLRDRVRCIYSTRTHIPYSKVRGKKFIKKRKK